MIVKNHIIRFNNETLIEVSHLKAPRYRRYYQYWADGHLMRHWGERGNSAFTFTVDLGRVNKWFVSLVDHKLRSTKVNRYL